MERVFEVEWRKTTLATVYPGSRGFIVKQVQYTLIAYYFDLKLDVQIYDMKINFRIVRKHISFFQIV